VKDAVVQLVGDDGPVLIVGEGGAVVSIVHVYEAAPLFPVLEPDGPRARTWNVCVLGASGPAYATPLAQDANEPASSLHSKVAFGAFVVNVNVALVALVELGGFVPMVGVAGAATVHVRVASPLVLPPFSARTRKVWLASERPA
jgi:hypothetical protein